MEDRYSRQELFSPIGIEGQKLIGKKHVLLIGAGALGTGNAEALVRAGVGKITIVDRDYVEESNLQRQQLYSEQDAIKRLPKAIAAKYRLEQINRFVSIEAKVLDAAYADLLSIAEEADLIIDATDNYDTRLVINDVAQKLALPWIYGACVGSYGMTFTILPGKTPCINCLWDKVPSAGGQTCDTAGIISAAVGMVVSYQVADALKILVEDLNSLSGKLTTFDLWRNTHSSIGVGKLKKSSCPSCGESPTYPYLSSEHTLKTAVLCGRDTIQIRPAEKKRVNLDDLHTIFSTQGLPVQYNPFLLSVEIDAKRMVIFQDGRVLIHGTSDMIEAKKTYHRVFS
ncbi:ThiF family adenylyltransferase [Jeotgalibacillus proteolyticus]|uniref:Thiamine biosynthesis protein MoeB n=1 Tax=Jeotgalibacillus proteolyticus TaxID=2082395 RepID=A0A2S5GDM7_9BACL|nr:ThiF family adenylyltransferase [Jeotgalibacillus proteolyticus]PPA71142.1 thiamine biosynthesis protein MoeB [Jeotgalibacillus proteolyticus]